MKRVIFDFETQSEADLKKQGAFKYSLHPSTRATCLAFKTRDDQYATVMKYEYLEKVWVTLPSSIRAIWLKLIEEGYEFCAHNAFFDMCIYKNVLVRRMGWPDIPFRQFRCTAAKAAACALPRNLKDAGLAMNLKVQKDMIGHMAVMATCKPTREWNAWKKKTDRGARLQEPPKFRTPQTDPQIYETLYQYCAIDVHSQGELDRSLPDLEKENLEYWFLNQKLNWRGLLVDIPLVQKIVNVMEVESKQRLKELDTLTMGLVSKPGSIKSILEFLALEGVELPNLQAQTVEDALKDKSLGRDMKKLLELRKAFSKTSTKKYEAFLHRACEDNKVRDLLLFHGASTGRDAGTGVQPQNFPRGLIPVEKEKPYAHVENVQTCDHDTLRLLYGDSIPILFSSILRNMILPSRGHELFVGDFSQIEVAVLWWMAGNVEGLETLRSGKDSYIQMACSNTGKHYDLITEAERQLGKAQVLGCGFGMGYLKFLSTAWTQYRLKLSEEQAREAVERYRSTHWQVPQMWRSLELAAIDAIKHPRQRMRSNRCALEVSNDFLWIWLPSGRKLAYRSPSIAWRAREYEVVDSKVENGKTVLTKRKVVSDPQETIEFYAVNSKTKKWGIERTWGGVLTENVVQATARDLMSEAAMRLERKGYAFLLAVHDEILSEHKKGSVEEFTKIMCEVPTWAQGCPIKVKAWKGPRYRK